MDEKRGHGFEREQRRACVRVWRERERGNDASILLSQKIKGGKKDSAFYNNFLTEFNTDQLEAYLPDTIDEGDMF